MLHVPLPIRPPLAPMLARLARELPRREGLVYEPKWDGFRCMVFRDGDEVDLRSRNERPLARYFPEIVEALRAVPSQQVVLDGELVVAGERGLDFLALMARLHPAASRVQRLAVETPASYVAFDLLAIGDEDLRAAPYTQRRQALAAVLVDPPPRIHVTPATHDPDAAARWIDGFEGTGIEGVVVKDGGAPYEPGKRAMTKVKRERTADCVVAGFRPTPEGNGVMSLLLGLQVDGSLRHVGVASSFTAAARRSLLADVRPLVTTLTGHPWQHGFSLAASTVGRLPGAVSRWAPGEPLTWVPLQPLLVCEVAYDALEGDRFRHAPRFRRWRPDRDPLSCTDDQLRLAPLHDAAAVLRGAS